MDPFELDFSFSVNLLCRDCIGRLRHAQYDHDSFSGTFLERREELFFDFYRLDDYQWDLSGEWRRATKKIVSIYEIRGCLHVETDTTTKVSGRVYERNSWPKNLILLGSFLFMTWVYLRFVPAADLFIPTLLISILILLLAVGLIQTRHRLTAIRQLIQRLSARLNRSRMRRSIRIGTKNWSTKLTDAVSLVW